jgi:transcription termination factor NusB
MKLGEGVKGKENDRESTISKYLTSVQVEDIRIYMKAVE